MIVGLGLDLAELDRIGRSLDRFGQRFLDRILTPGEQAALPLVPGSRAAYVAARFAAKEAAVKALGTGFSHGISPLDIEVVRLPSGQPTLLLHHAAADRAAALGIVRCHLSLTHSRTTAAAVVLLEN